MDPQAQIPSPIPIPSTTPRIPTATSSTPPRLNKAQGTATPAPISQRLGDMPDLHHLSYQDRSSVASAFLKQGFSAHKDVETQIHDRYATANSDDKAAKIEALKNHNLDPNKLNDPVDSIAHGLNLWKTVASNAMAKHPNDPQMQQRIAEGFYLQRLAPYYDKLGILNHMPKDLWLKNAYSKDGALAYDLHNTYLPTAVSGLYRALADTAMQLENLGAVGVNMLGMLVHGAAYYGRQALDSQLPDSTGGIKAYKDATDWHRSLLATNTFEDAKYKGMGFFKRAEAITQSYGGPTDVPLAAGNPLQALATTSKVLGKYSNSDQFWANVNPSRGAVDGLTSFVTELAATAPIFGGIKGGMNALGAEAAEMNLTKILGASAKGKVIAKALVNGTEGLAYGTLTRPITDKREALQDALNFAVLGTVFGLGGDKLASSLKGKKLTLGDVIKEHGTPEEIKDHIENKQRLEMSVRDKKRPATAAELRDAHVTHRADAISVLGRQGMDTLDQHALNLVTIEERAGASEAEVKASHDHMKASDPAKAEPFLAARGFIKGFLGDRKLTDLDEAEMGELREQLKSLSDEAQDKINRKSSLISDANGERGVTDKASPDAKRSEAYWIAKATLAAQKDGTAAHIGPEGIKANALEMQKKAAKRAAGQAEKVRNSKPIEEAEDIADKRSASVRRSGQESGGESKSKITSRFGLKEGASASHNTEHLAYLRANAGGTKDADLSKFYGTGLSTGEGRMAPEDFEKELEEYFYPKDLKDEGIYFEHETAQGQRENPNFLAFMYNYKDQMPPATAKHLEEELLNSMKVSENLRGFRPDVDQAWLYALHMYNHVDTFLGSTAHVARGEKNVFRTTTSDLLNPTKYQAQLLKEYHVENKKLLRGMFEGRPKEARAAVIAYNILASPMDAAFKAKPTVASATRYREAQDVLAQDMIDRTQHLDESLIPWRF